MYIALYLVGICLFLYAIHKLERKKILLPEIRRKILHIGSGFGALIFPTIFTEKRDVIILTIAIIIILYLVRKLPKAKNGIVRVLETEDRKTYGDYYFPLSILAVWFLCNGNLILYYIPVLILMFSDSTAALIGKFYGKFKYTAIEGKKSIEGSAIFFITTYLFTSTILNLFTEMNVENIILISSLLGLVQMTLEAISWRGLDNLFIPLMSFFMLKIFIGESTFVLFLNFIVSVVLFIGVLIGKKRRTLASDGLLATFFYAYITFFLGGIIWLLIPTVVYLIYPFIITEKTNKKIHHANILLVIGLPALFWMLLSKYLNMDILILPYLTVYASHLSIIGVARIRTKSKMLPSRKVIVLNSIVGIIFMTIFLIFIKDINKLSCWALSSVAIILSTLIFNKLVPIKENYLLNKYRYQKHAITVFICSIITLIAVL